MTNDEVMRKALEALEYMHAEKCDYMIRNKLGDPSRETATKLAVAAIAGLRNALSARPEPQAAVSDAEIIRIACETQTAEPGRDGYVLPISFARAVLAASRQVPVIPAGAVLERLKYHWQEADPEMPDIPATWEAFPPDVDCATCIPVLVVRADAVKVSPLPAGEPRQEEGERSGGVDLPDGAQQP